MQIGKGFTQIPGLTVVFQVQQMGFQHVGSLGGDLRHDAPLVVRWGFPFLYGDGTERTMTDASSQTVAGHLTDQPRLPVDQLQGAFGAVDDAVPATGAFLFVYFYDLAFHIGLPG